jgi:hypothetical protein
MTKNSTEQPFGAVYSTGKLYMPFQPIAATRALNLTAGKV